MKKILLAALFPLPFGLAFAENMPKYNNPEQYCQQAAYTSDGSSMFFNDCIDMEQ